MERSSIQHGVDDVPQSEAMGRYPRASAEDFVAYIIRRINGARILKYKKTIEPRPSYELGYQDSNLENAGVRVQCLTIWRQPIIMKFGDSFVSHKLVLYYMSIENATLFLKKVTKS